MSLRLRLHNLVRVLRNTDGARREALRVHTFRLAGRITPFVGVEHDGVRYLISTRESAGVGFSTFVHGVFAEQTLRRMLTELEQRAGIATLDGLTVLEVGANIGTETVSMLVRHKVGRVVAIEPDPENVRLLRANLALNGVEERAEVLQLALSDVDQTLLLERSEQNWGDHRIRDKAPSGPALLDEDRRATVEVSAHRLDSLAAAGAIDLDAIDLVWMDAQGHEAHILAGAERLMATDIPILTEYWPYGLRRVGALDRFHSLIARRGGLVVDLRVGRSERTLAIAATQVAELALDYVSADYENFESHGDLLLLP